MPILSCRHLTRIFPGQDHPALDDISLAIPAQRFVAIMGPSGCGKSTLLYALAGLDRPSQGQVFFQGQDLWALSDDQRADLRRQQMGFVFQDPSFLLNLSILDNLLLTSLQDHPQDRQALETRAHGLLKRAGIADLWDRLPKKVSGGQLQRAGVCRALMAQPSLIFADEPTGALNSQASRGIMEVFQEVHTLGTSLVLVTHDPKVATYADQVLLMKDGRIEEDLHFSPGQGQAQKESLIQEKMARWSI